MEPVIHLGLAHRSGGFWISEFTDPQIIKLGDIPRFTVQGHPAACVGRIRGLDFEAVIEIHIDI